MRDEPEFLRHQAGLIEQRVQLFVFEGRVSDLNSTLAQQRLPLLEAITLAWRGVVERGHQCKDVHNFRGSIQEQSCQKLCKTIFHAKAQRLRKAAKKTSNITLAPWRNLCALA